MNRVQARHHRRRAGRFPRHVHRATRSTSGCRLMQETFDNTGNTNSRSGRARGPNASYAFLKQTREESRGAGEEENVPRIANGLENALSQTDLKARVWAVTPHHHCGKTPFQNAAGGKFRGRSGIHVGRRFLFSPDIRLRHVRTSSPRALLHARPTWTMRLAAYEARAAAFDKQRLHRGACSFRYLLRAAAIAVAYGSPQRGSCYAFPRHRSPGITLDLARTTGVRVLLLSARGSAIGSHFFALMPAVRRADSIFPSRSVLLASIRRGMAGSAAAADPELSAPLTKLSWSKSR